MKLQTLVGLVRSGQLGLLLATSRAMRASYRLSFLGAGLASGLLPMLAGGPRSRDAIAARMGAPLALRDGLDAWLGLGVWLGELRLGPGGYRLRSRLARRLADPANDAGAAMMQEASTLHQRLILETPARLRERRPFTLADQDGALVARSSRTLEPIVCDAIDAVVPRRGPAQLLEVGCGSAVYVRHAASLNPELTALALELQPEVATMARANVADWGLAGRVVVETGDVRTRAPERRYDVATLHNNIYYFPVDERVDVLRHLRGFLVSGGRLLVTTVCLGKGVAVDILNLWGAMTAGCGRLPAPAEMVGQLEAAGFAPVRARSMIPSDSYYAFVGTAP